MIYKSTDQGSTWSYVSTVDTGGPFDYDRSTTSTTTTIWEPFLYMDDYGRLVCAFSDERQKSNNVLQALSLRYTSNGTSWSSLVNICAISNLNDRPGMFTVTKLPNGKYLAAYEVVNRPSYNQNSSVVYCKFSDDGITWDASNLGTLVQTDEGLCLGSSPYIKWVDAGGPNGMVIIGSKWVVNSSGDIQNGGQNFFVNYNLGQGNWERYPQPLSWNGADVTYLDAFSQSIETNVDDTVLYQTANIVNSSATAIDLRVGTMPLTMGIYEAENAILTDCSTRTNQDSSNGQEVGYINYSTSVINFDDVKVPTNNTYTIYVRYNNGSGATSSHLVQVDSGSNITLSYPTTLDWNRNKWVSFTAYLTAGTHSIKLKYNGTYAEVDCIAVDRSGSDLSRDFVIKNRNSGKILETPSMSTANNEVLKQYSVTNYPCQIWTVYDAGSGYYKLKNKNSDKYCQILNAATTDGANAVQYSSSSSYNQQWSLISSGSGYWHLVNRNSDKFLEVLSGLTTDSAPTGQWSDSGYSCQEWTFLKEGIQ